MYVSVLDFDHCSGGIKNVIGGWAIFLFHWKLPWTINFVIVERIKLNSAYTNVLKNTFTLDFKCFVHVDIILSNRITLQYKSYINDRSVSCIKQWQEKYTTLMLLIPDKQHICPLLQHYLVMEDRAIRYCYVSVQYVLNMQKSLALLLPFNFHVNIWWACQSLVIVFDFHEKLMVSRDTLVFLCNMFCGLGLLFFCFSWSAVMPFNNLLKDGLDTFCKP